MQIVIDISEYDKEWITNSYHIPDEINQKIAETIINGTPLPKGHGDLVDRDKVIDLLNEQEYNYYTELDKVCDTVYEADTIIEADKESE